MEVATDEPKKVRKQKKDPFNFKNPAKVTKDKSSTKPVSRDSVRREITTATRDPDDPLDITSKFGPVKASKVGDAAQRGDTVEQPSIVPDSSKPADPSSSKSSRSSTTKSAAPSGPMIIVHVNDRLGTKAAIPCLASDPIRLFKAQVAARIGRQPHEIMLKRQGERPFKDQLTLEDYGVSNGVQLDLELDAGD